MSFRSPTVFVALFPLFALAGTELAIATTWNYTGTITDCNDAICSLVPMSVGDPVEGSITIDVGVNDAFTLDNTFTDFDFSIADVVDITHPDVTGGDGVILTGSGTTDADGDFASGALSGEFVGGTFGGLGGDVQIILTAGTMELTVGFGTVFVASVEGAFVIVGIDGDKDGIPDSVDNCSATQNADQRDTDGDGIGNRCDPDIAIPNDCLVDFLDLMAMEQNFFAQGDLDTDFNGDGLTNLGDVGIMKQYFFGPPGASGLANPCE